MTADLTPEAQEPYAEQQWEHDADMTPSWASALLFADAHALLASDPRNRMMQADIQAVLALEARIAALEDDMVMVEMHGPLRMEALKERDDARAEVAALRRQYGVSMGAALQREDDLRVENERLTTQDPVAAALTGPDLTREQLLEALAVCNDKWAADIDRIAALEAALHAGVATHGEPCLAGDDCGFIRAARAALAGTGR